MRWTKLAAAAATATWDAQLTQFTDHNLYQSARWGRYKQVTRGWTPHYFHAEDNGRRVAMLQALVREYPLRTVVAWCPGGPVGCLDACAPESMRQLQELLDARRLYCRSSFMRPATGGDVERLRAHAWSQPDQHVGAARTAIWDLTPTEDQLMAGLNRNWRYSLRQAQARLRVERLDPVPVDALVSLTRTMNAAKGIGGVLDASQVAAMFDALGPDTLVYGCRGEQGQLIGFHSCAIQADRAWELLAATSDEGRSAGASFAVLWAMMLECRRRGVREFDLAGIDVEKAPGVASFKKWTGAREVERLGEWEWSSSALLRKAVAVQAARRSAAALP